MTQADHESYVLANTQELLTALQATIAIQATTAVQAHHEAHVLANTQQVADCHASRLVYAHGANEEVVGLKGFGVQRAGCEPQGQVSERNLAGKV